MNFNSPNHIEANTRMYYILCRSAKFTDAIGKKLQCEIELGIKMKSPKLYQQLAMLIGYSLLIAKISRCDQHTSIAYNLFVAEITKHVANQSLQRNHQRFAT